MLRNVGKTIRSLRKMTGDFQRQFDEALKEAELDDVANITKSKSFQPLEDAKKSMEAYQKKVSAELNTPFGEDGPAAEGKSADTSTKNDKPEAETKPASKPASRKAEPKKTEAKKTVAKKSATSKPAVKKAAGKKAASKKPPAAKSARAKTPAKNPKSGKAATGTSA